MRRLRVDVGADDVGLDFVAMDLGAVVGVVDRVQHRQQLVRLVAVALHRECQHRPDRAMGVLSAVLADAGADSP